MSRTLVHAVVVVICLGVVMSADASASKAKPPKKYTETVVTQDGEKLRFDMVLIPSGSFLMGSPADETGRKDDEGPQHRVRLDSFYLCTTEATLDLFAAYYQETVSAKKDFITVQEAKKNTKQAGKNDVDVITGPTPVYGDMTMGYGEKHPAIAMTWHSAVTFCRWLSQKTGKEYRLPTESEWEYACRAGTSTAFGCGFDPKDPASFAWCEVNADGEAHEVGKKKPNAWGLYDMAGNVREWVSDFYSPTAYEEAAKQSPAVNPRGPKTGKVHVARGGDYDSPVEELRCAARAFEEEWWRSGDPQIPKSIWWLPERDIVGFRVARSVETASKKSD
ncbi:MAG: SUMF1/EgtB/PvdO family nonheme iron enzyme [Phycisphaerales bacterium]|nr:MAG: SUMF1/EgtB/PvdO family nonheme iron enzyme [Phycisphaerales bacterium]